MKLSDLEVPSFDCHGTLLDRDTGIYAAFAGVTQAGDRLSNHPRVLSRKRDRGEVRGKGLLLALDLS